MNFPAATTAATIAAIATTRTSETADATAAGEADGALSGRIADRDPFTAPSCAIPDEMDAVTQRRYGSSDVLQMERLDTPTPGRRQVVIEVGAAGLDRGVVHLMSGLPYLIRFMGFGLRRPKQPVPGLDVAGRVVAVGDDVGKFVVGDEVMGIGSGSFAEYAVADVDKLTLRPSNLSVEQAAASTISGITALQALTEVGRVEAGQRVLVIGASGGVGSFAVQIAAALGATVTGVAGPTKLDAVRALGAAHVVDHTETAIDEIGERFDLVIDIGGRNPLRRVRRVIAERGTLVIVGGENGGNVTGGIGRNLRAVLWSAFVPQRLTAFISSESSRFIEALAEMLADGRIEPLIGRAATLADAPAAVAALERGEVTGKAVITVRGDRHL